MMSLKIVCRGMTSVVLLAASVWGEVFTDGTAALVADGATATATGETATVPQLTVDGTLSLVGSAITVSGSAVSVAGSGTGLSGTVNVDGTSTLTVKGTGSGEAPGTSSFYIGYCGGVGELAIAAGGRVVVQGTRTRLAGNISNETRALAATMRCLVTVDGTFENDLVEMAACYPTIEAADSDANFLDNPNFMEGVTLHLNEGGTFSTYYIYTQDRSYNYFYWNGGTWRAKRSGAMMAGGGPFSVILPEGKTGIFDSNGKDVILLNPISATRSLWRSISGAGGLRKRGAGSLTFNLPAAANTFTGPIFVEEGTLSLGRPLAEGQTVTVSAGANFIAAAPADLAKIVWLGGTAEKRVFEVTGTLPGLDLVNMGDIYYTDRLSAPVVNGNVYACAITGLVTHAAASAEAPFHIILPNSTAKLQLQNTDIEKTPFYLEGTAGTLEFLGNRIVPATEFANLMGDAGTTFRQAGVLTLGAATDANQVATVAVPKGMNFQTGGALNVGLNGGKAKLTMEGGTLTASGGMYVGYDGGEGVFTKTGGALTVTGELRIGGSSGSRAVARGAVILSNVTATVSTAVRFVPSAPTDGTYKGKLDDVHASLELGPGTKLSTPYVYRNDDPTALLRFTGGCLFPTANNETLLCSGQNGKLIVEAPAGNDIFLDITAGRTNAFNNTTTAGTILRGAGGLRKTGNGFLKYGDNTRIVAEYEGETYIDDGTVDFDGDYILPYGAGKGDTKIASRATLLSRYGYAIATHNLTGFGNVYTTTVENRNSWVSVGYGEDDIVWTAKLLGRQHIQKRGSGTMYLASVVDKTLKVAEGGISVTGAVSYPHYRFRVLRTKGRTTMMQIDELKLLNDGQDVTGLRTGYGYNGVVGTDCPDGEHPGLALDGKVENKSKWLDKRASARNADTIWENCWIQLDYAEPQRVTHFTYATGNDSPERDPSSFELLGSADGETWSVISRVNEYQAIATRNAWIEDVFPVGAGFTTEAFVDVQKGARFEATDAVLTMGALLADTAAFTNTTLALHATQDAETYNRVMNFFGTGSLEKSGPGAATLGLGASTFEGDVTVKAGTLRLRHFVPEANAKFFRFLFHQERLDGAMLQLSELALYDVAGTRVGMNLARKDPSTAATNLTPGSCCASAGDSTNAKEQVGNLFDSNTATKWCLNHVQGTTLEVTLRLADGTAPVAGYNFTFANDSQRDRVPVSWTVQASADGTTWTTIDEKQNDIATIATYEVYNNGVPYMIGWDDGAAVPLAANAVIDVKAGATLDLSPATELSRLRVDCTDAGTVTAFTAAANGVIDLVNFPSATALNGYRVPLGTTAIGRAPALHSWRVLQDGVEHRGYHLTVSQGNQLLVLANGLTIYLR